MNEAAANTSIGIGDTNRISIGGNHITKYLEVGSCSSSPTTSALNMSNAVVTVECTETEISDPPLIHNTGSSKGT
jgi:hypothetical protein